MKKIFITTLFLIAFLSIPALAQPKGDHDALGALINEIQIKANGKVKASAVCDDFIENKVGPPLNDENNKGKRLEFPQCSSRPQGYLYCKSMETQQPLSFSFSNEKSSKLVPESNSSRSRKWEFQFPNRARQDIHIRVTDAPNSQNSQLRESYLYLFPRKNTPAIRVEGSRMIVTLTTGEEVIYNAKTKDVIGGVFAETGPLTSVSRELNPAKIEYTGSGVMVRVNARGSDPRLGGGNATISKKGKTCNVPKADLWPDRNSSSALHFRFSRDADFDSYLKSKCGFGI